MLVYQRVSEIAQFQEPQIYGLWGMVTTMVSQWIMRYSIPRHLRRKLNQRSQEWSIWLGDAMSHDQSQATDPYIYNII
jgi:hypothetical protein